jgi:aryl-alcohol dehydrogenase-like predicted oxidoreductase
MNRRSILKTAGIALVGSVLAPFDSLAQSALSKPILEKDTLPNTLLGKRKLGASLEVSSIGLGVQNMSRTYQTTIPSRTEMHHIIRTAFDKGVTLFDAAEAYGPFEVERILGEAITPFRDKIVIETKFGWNIDQETGNRLPGLNSRPEHIKIVVEGMLKRLRTDRIDLLYQHRVDPQVPIEDVVGAIQDLSLIHI